MNTLTRLLLGKLSELRAVAELVILAHGRTCRCRLCEEARGLADVCQDATEAIRGEQRSIKA